MASTDPIIPTTSQRGRQEAPDTILVDHVSSDFPHIVSDVPPKEAPQYMRGSYIITIDGIGYYSAPYIQAVNAVVAFGPDVHRHSILPAPVATRLRGHEEQYFISFLDTMDPRVASYLRSLLQLTQ